jgi:hypothetical protein
MVERESHTVDEQLAEVEGAQIAGSNAPKLDYSKESIGIGIID